MLILLELCGFDDSTQYCKLQCVSDQMYCGMAVCLTRCIATWQCGSDQMYCNVAVCLTRSTASGQGVSGQMYCSISVSVCLIRCAAT